MTDSSDLVWQGRDDRIVISPVAGGRVLSWTYAGAERVNPPMMLEGGLMRVLFAEEQYPGTSYVAPHRVMSRESGSSGFRIGLRHLFNLPNAFMRLCDWPDKANLLHLDALLL